MLSNFSTLILLKETLPDSVGDTVVVVDASVVVSGGEVNTAVTLDVSIIVSDTMVVTVVIAASVAVSTCKFDPSSEFDWYIVVSDSIVEIGVVVVVNVSVHENNITIILVAIVVDPPTIHEIKELLVHFGRVGVIIISVTYKLK